MGIRRVEPRDVPDRANNAASRRGPSPYRNFARKSLGQFMSGNYLVAEVTDLPGPVPRIASVIRSQLTAMRNHGVVLITRGDRIFLSRVSGYQLSKLAREQRQKEEVQ